jgi:hypothetical protein
MRKTITLACLHKFVVHAAHSGGLLSRMQNAAVAT